MTPEAKVKTKIVAYLKSLRDGLRVPLYWFSPVGSMYGKAGVPDIIVCWGGMFVGIEVKAPGKIKNTSTLQDVAHKSIRAANGRVIVVDDVEMVKEFFEGAPRE